MKTVRGLSILSILIFVLSACNSNELAFRTLVQSRGSEYEGVDPRVVVISSLEDLKGLRIEMGKRISLDAKVEGLDYDQEFAILVLNGWRGYNENDIHVKKVVRDGSEVLIYAEFEQPDLNGLVSPGAVSPYHLIAVEKTGKWDQEITFSLLDEARTSSDPLYQMTHFFPSSDTSFPETPTP